jgi:uncharacterized protein (DUF1330 family)
MSRSDRLRRRWIGRSAAPVEDQHCEAAPLLLVQGGCDGANGPAIEITPKEKRVPRWVGSSSRVSAGLASAYAGVMPAYVIADADVQDPERYERYRAVSPDAIAAGGGRFIARGGEVVVLEGDWRPKRLVLLEFEDVEAARA